MDRSLRNISNILFKRIKAILMPKGGPAFHAQVAGKSLQMSKDDVCRTWVEEIKQQPHVTRLLFYFLSSGVMFAVILQSEL